MPLKSYNALLFLAIQERIKTKVPKVKWIDHDLGQLEVQQERPTVLFPCVLIDLPDTQFDDESEGAQIGNPTIEIRIGFAPFTYTNHVAPLPAREAALEYYEIEQEVFEALHGWEPVGADGTILGQSMLRRSARTERREDTIRVRSLSFVSMYEDGTAKKKRRTVSVSPRITN